MIRSSLRTACHYVIGLAITAIVLRTWLVMGLIVPVVVSGSSMAPTLDSGDRLIIDRTAFWFRSPREGEVVVLQCPGRADEYCVKRVVGLPGDTMSLVNGELFTNERRVLKKSDVGQASRLPDIPTTAGETPAPRSWQLGPDEYFVIGDNLTVSDDSRSWAVGPSARLLIGKPFGVR